MVRDDGLKILCVQITKTMSLGESGITVARLLGGFGVWPGSGQSLSLWLSDSRYLG